jgi:outer membrane protein TolC
MRSKIIVTLALISSMANGAEVKRVKSSPVAARPPTSQMRGEYQNLLKQLNIYETPPEAKRLLKLKDIYALVLDRGSNLKVAREDLNKAKQSRRTDEDKKKPVVSLDVGHDQKWTKTKSDSDVSDNYVDRDDVFGNRTSGSRAGFSLTGSPLQGLNYKASFPQLVHQQSWPDSSTTEPKRPDSAAFSVGLDLALLKDSPFLVDGAQTKKLNLTLTRAKQTYRSQVISKITEAESAFFSLLQKSLKYRQIKRSLIQARALERDVKEKITAGESSALEATRAELQTAQTETDVMSFEIEYEKALQTFRKNLAFNDTSGDGVFPDPKELEIIFDEQSTKGNELTEILKNNADIIAARAAKSAADIDVEIARNQSQPKLSLATNYQNASPGEGWSKTAFEATRPNDRTFSVELTYSQVLYNDTQKNALKESVFAKQKAELAVSEVEEKISSDYKALIQSLVIGNRRCKIAKTTRDIAEKKLASEYEKFKVGESAVKLVIDSQTELNDAILREIDARIEYLLAFNNLRAMKGQLPLGVEVE